MRDDEPIPIDDSTGATAAEFPQAEFPSNENLNEIQSNQYDNDEDSNESDNDES